MTWICVRTTQPQLPGDLLGARGVEARTHALKSRDKGVGLIATNAAAGNAAEGRL